MSPLSMQVLDCIRRNPGGYSMAELERILKRPAQEIENSVSSLRSAKYIVQDGDAHWRIASKPVNGYDGVVHPGERRICAQCHIAKGAQAYIAGNTICNLCLDKPSSPAPQTPKEIAMALRTCYGGQHKCKRCCIEVNAEQRRTRRATQQPPATSAARDERPTVIDSAPAHRLEAAEHRPEGEPGNRTDQPFASTNGARPFWVQEAIADLSGRRKLIDEALGLLEKLWP